MQTLRTPDDRFTDLPEFPYPANYCDVSDGDGGTLRMAWVQDGPADADPVLMLHGEPSWSFLYRKMIPVLAAAGHRVICPDLVGFGRSDKPTRIEDHSYARHVEWVRELAFDALDLQRVTLVGQDWGGLIGLRLAAEHPERFSKLVVANTGLPTGDIPMPEIWWQFRKAIQSAPTIDVGRFVQGGCRRPMSDEIRAAYDAPFPDDSYCAAPRAMPGLVPTSPDDPAAPANRSAWAALECELDADAGRLQRRRSDHRRHGADLAARNGGRTGDRPPGRRQRGPLPSRRRRRGARRVHRRLLGWMRPRRLGRQHDTAMLNVSALSRVGCSALKPSAAPVMWYVGPVIVTAASPCSSRS